MWEATIGRPASLLIDSHLRAASDRVGDPLDVVDLGAGSGRSLDRLERLGLPVRSYLGIEQDPSAVAASHRRTSHRPGAVVRRGRIEQLPSTRQPTPRLVLLTWVLSSLDRPAQALDLARRLTGPDGMVVVAALTCVGDRATLLDHWIRHRWQVRPVDPTLLAPGAVRLDVTHRGRAIVATIEGCDEPDPPPRDGARATHDPSRGGRANPSTAGRPRAAGA